MGLGIWECCTATTSKLGRSDLHNLHKLTVLRPNSIYPARPNDSEILSSSIDAHMATTPEFEVISSLTRPGASAKNAVQRLLLLTAAASKDSPNDDVNGALSLHIRNVWSALVEDVVANTDSAQQDELVEFVRELRLQKMINHTTNSPLLYNLVADQHVPLWTGLPLFGISVRDEWNFGMLGYIELPRKY